MKALGQAVMFLKDELELIVVVKGSPRYQAYMTDDRYQLVEITRDGIIVEVE